MARPTAGPGPGQNMATSLFGRLDFCLWECPANGRDGRTARRYGGTWSDGDAPDVVWSTGRRPAAATTAAVPGRRGGVADDTNDDDDGVEEERRGDEGTERVVDTAEQGVSGSNERRHSGVTHQHALRRHHLYTSATRSPQLTSSWAYLADSVEGRRHLRSSATTTLVVPPVRRSTLGDRAFPVADPRAWNGLPLAVRAAPSLITFRRELKTFLFFCIVWALSTAEST